MNSGCDHRCSQRRGFPIRTSPDHGLLASPRSLSQLATSFIAYLRQGIHTHALSSLTIKLTLDITTKCNFALTSAPRRILAARRDLQLVLPINIQLSKNFAGSRSGLRIGPTRHRTTETIRQFARSTSTKCNVRTVGEYSFSALPRFSAAERLKPGGPG